MTMVKDQIRVHYNAIKRKFCYFYGTKYFREMIKIVTARVISGLSDF